ncbi:MAG: SURF1 family protein [Nitratireductor sp.]
MSRVSRAVLVVMMLASLGVLISLGNWQVRRLHWKEALIADVQARRNGEPEPLAMMIRHFAETGDVDYRPVTAEGEFDHSREVYFYTTRDGTVGWDVITPLHLTDAGWLLVNRGFVPDQLRNPDLRKEGELRGKVTIAGLARNPLAQKPNSYMPDNRPDKREFYWKSFVEITGATGLSGDPSLVPFMVDAGPSEIPGGLPKGGSTIISFSNSHLQYAITWYGLALALAGVGGWFLFTSRSSKAAN